MKNKTSIKNYSICLVFFISFFSFSALAQENGIFELKQNARPSASSKTNSLVVSISKDSKSTIDARAEFNTLVYKLHPTVYVKNGIVKKTYGEGPIIKLTLEDVNSISSLSSLASNYPEIELLTIKLNSISDINSTLDLNSISNLSKLKYVFIKGRFNCNEALLNRFVNYSSNTRVFYLCGESE
ncbi:hypothetical protein [Seonamhaeicola sp.]|uniref:hypothetical protein n=1 Tax=Seonamhaeicola sp. TaxID=1912245 RepID=UPI00261CD4FE|nr:hypothetical protein [Seonamhaeicola sp.]